MASWPAARLLSFLPEQQAADIVGELPSAEAETLLRLMTDAQRNAVLEHMPDTITRSFTRKLAFPVSTVGAWMDTSIPSFTKDSSVADCLDLVRRQKSHLGGVVIVIDERRRLLGLVEIQNLLTSEGTRQLSDLLSTDVEPLPARATLWEVEYHDGWTQFPTLPVIDRNNIMLGALTHGALRAGTAKSAEALSGEHKFSLLGHIGRAFYVALTGLLHVISGVVPDHKHVRPKSPSYSHEKAAGER